MFSIQEKNFGPYTEYILSNSITGEYCSVLPSFGAVINQVALAKKGKVYELLEGSKNFQELITEGKSRFKGSKLFPFPNRIADGRYQFENNTYQFPVNFPHENNAIHGTVLESNFAIKTKWSDEKQALIEVEYNTIGNEPGYPFRIKLVVKYLLQEDGFSCTTTVYNNAHKNIPIGDGWHPYLKTGAKMDDCILSIPVEKSYEVDDRMIPTGKTNPETIFINPTKIGATTFDTGYKTKVCTDNIAVTSLTDTVLDITIKLWQKSGKSNYDFLQVYIPPDRLSIAIEPMTCLANAFNNKEGLIFLKPGDSQEFSFGLKLE